MAANVFGNPITNETLRGTEEFRSGDITRMDRARVAMRSKNVGGKDVSARQFVEDLHKRFAPNRVATLCLIYNATGDTVLFNAARDYEGFLGQSPFPLVLENGQWGAFLHISLDPLVNVSKGAVMYQGKNKLSDVCNWMFSWQVARNFTNRVVTQGINGLISPSNMDDIWNRYDPATAAVSNTVFVDRGSGKDYVSMASIGNNFAPVLEGVMTLPGAN